MSQNPEKELIGHYKNEKMTKYERIYYNVNKNVRRQIIGSSLDLNEDKTFHFETCGLLIDGNWAIKNEKLVLSPITNRFKNDSIAKIKTPDLTGRGDFFKFSIKKNKLVTIVINSNGSKSLNKLVKR